jgi:ABC-2 type transport system permease protein
VSAIAPPQTAHRPSALTWNVRTVVRQVGYEQRAFWRTPQSAVFTFALPVVFMVMFASINSGHHLSSLGGVSAVQYFIPSMLAYGVMSACFVNLAIGICFRRETGVLKRIRGTPLPAWAYLASVVGNAFVISILEVLVALAIGKLGYHIHFPSHWVPFLVAVGVGACAFSALGLAISCVVPNAEAAPAVVNLPYLVLVIFSGAFYPFPPNSAIAKVTNFFPVSHFIHALFAPFNTVPGSSPWRWGDLLVVAIWGVAGLVFTLRRFSWEPKRG